MTYSRQIYELIKPFGVERKFTTKEILFLDGQEAEGFYYVISGEVRLYKMDENAKELELKRLTANNFIGEVVLFASETYPASAEVLADTSLLFFPKKLMLKAIDEQHDLAKMLLVLFAKKCYSLNQFIDASNLKTIRMKLVDYLMSLCDQRGDCLITLPLKKSDIARQLGTISATLSRNFAKLESEGLLKVTGRKIKILDCKRLKDF